MFLVFADLLADMSVTEAECRKNGAADDAVDWFSVVGLEVADELWDTGKGDTVMGEGEGAGEGVVTVDGGDEGC